MVKEADCRQDGCKYSNTVEQCVCVCVFIIRSGSALHEDQQRDRTYKVQLLAKPGEEE